MSPECMDYNYEYLAKDNMMEWFVSMVMTWDNLGMLGMMGPIIILSSMASIVDVYICDWCLPNINQNWDDMTEWKRMYLEWISFVSHMGQPTAFMMSQMYTMGESNLRDTSVLYMD